jgi:hypothetical protein
MDEDRIVDRVVDGLKPKSPTAESVRRKNLNPQLSSPVEFQSSILVPQTGRAKIGEDLEGMYKIKRTNSSGISQQDDAWDYFSALTSDVRISNLDPKSSEYAYVQWCLKMMFLCLQLGYPKSAAIVQGMMLSVTEPSLAKDMKFLMNIQTVRQESQHIQVEEQPKSSRNLFGFLKKGKVGG